MPVTKTAKRALRSSKKKEEVNKRIRSNLEVAIRIAKKSSKGRSASGRKKTEESISTAISLADRASKKGVIHKHKAARIKSSLSRLLSSSPKTLRAGGKIKSAKTSAKR